MPHPDDPNGLALDAIEEAVPRNDDLSVGEIGEFRKGATRLGKPLQPTQHGLGSPFEPPGGGRIIAYNVRDRIKELPPA